jgi:hypothetical protein
LKFFLSFFFAFARVSFGSTKGSMVETLIFESPLNEEEPSTPSVAWKANKSRNLRTLMTSTPLAEESEALISESSSRSSSKVRVTYFESKRPLTLPSPEASDAEWDDTMAEPPPQQHPNYTRQISAESGQDNPFRPDGDLSREADELVELLKGGRPISEVLKNREAAKPGDGEPHGDQLQHVDESCGSPARNPSLPSSSPSSPVKEDAVDANRRNGSGLVAEPVTKKTESPNAVEVQRAVVAPVGAGQSQVEHVVIKKKSKCQCCVIQ